MKLRLLTTALVALAGAFVAQTANAQIASPDDLVLSFQESGFANDLEVNLGLATQFSPTATFSSINLSADLVAQFGSTWFSSPTLEWSVVGTNNTGITDASGNIKNSLFVSDPGTAFTAKSTSALGTSATTIAKIYNPTGPTAGLDAGAFIVSASATNSFTNDITGTGLYGTFTGGPGVAFNSFGTGSSSTMSLDLLNANNTSTIDTAGIFTIDATGTVSFGAAVPEPSTYALMLAGALLLAFQINRRKSSVSRL